MSANSAWASDRACGRVTRSDGGHRRRRRSISHCSTAWRHHRGIRFSRALGVARQLVFADRLHVVIVFRILEKKSFSDTSRNPKTSRARICRRRERRRDVLTGRRGEIEWRFLLLLLRSSYGSKVVVWISQSFLKHQNEMKMTKRRNLKFNLKNVNVHYFKMRNALMVTAIVKGFTWRNSSLLTATSFGLGPRCLGLSSRACPTVVGRSPSGLRSVVVSAWIKATKILILKK